MAKKPSNVLDDVNVVIPYKRLCELLQASEEVAELRKDNALLHQQLTAVRIIQTQCLEKIRDLEKYL